MVGRREGRARTDRGAAAVEFALIVLPLCILVFGIISFGMMLSFRQTLSQAATEGARAAAVEVNPSNREGSGLTAINDAMQPVGVTCSGSELRVDGQPAGSCAVGEPRACDDPPGAGEAAQCVTVTVDYEYRENPVVPSFIIGGLLPQNLVYSSTVRVS